VPLRMTTNQGEKRICHERTLTQALLGQQSCLED
jgi:hypothetical protein